MTNEQFLVGKTIKDIMVADDKMAIKFICDDGEHIARADTDCCAHTWIEHMELPALGFPCQVVKAEDLGIEDITDPDEEYDDRTLKYGLKLTTDRGEIVIDYRNESNGYYGGDLVWPGGSFYGGVNDQNVSTEQWVTPNQALG